MLSVMIGSIADFWRGSVTLPTVYWKSSPSFAAEAIDCDRCGGVESRRSARSRRPQSSCCDAGAAFAQLVALARSCGRRMPRDSQASSTRRFVRGDAAVVHLRPQAREQLRARPSAAWRTAADTDPS